jgi:polyhydroxyalkanoate synthesis repressor PhaR
LVTECIFFFAQPDDLSQPYVNAYVDFGEYCAIAKQLLIFMITSPVGPKPVLQIRKYSNRRFYDTTHSRHMTLEEIRDLIKEGHGVMVTDNKSGTDITAKVLAQIILSLDGPKIEMFPAVFLAEIIRVNDLLLKGFYEKFFHQASRAFLDYQKFLESHLTAGGGLPSMFPASSWSQSTMNVATGNASAQPPSKDSEPANTDHFAATLAALQQEVARLQSQLAKSRKPAPARSTAGRRK